MAAGPCGRKRFQLWRAHFRRFPGGYQFSTPPGLSDPPDSRCAAKAFIDKSDYKPARTVTPLIDRLGCFQTTLEPGQAVTGASLRSPDSDDLVRLQTQSPQRMLEAILQGQLRIGGAIGPMHRL